MLEQVILREQFQVLLDKEREAEKVYAEQAAKVASGLLRAQIEQLRRDKQRHIRLIERLLEIVD